MKKILLFFTVILLFLSCTKEKITYDKITFNTYDEFVIYRLNRMKAPIILIKKQGYQSPYTSKDTLYSIMVKDNDGNIDYYDYHSDVSTMIGSTYEINDTIRK